MTDSFFPVVDFVPDGIEEAFAFPLPDIADKRRFTNNILNVFESIVSEIRVFCPDEIQNRMVQVSHFGIIQDRKIGIVSQNEFIDI